MRRLLLLAAATALLSASCSAPRSHITDMVDMPLRSTSVPGMDWQSSPLRAHAKYLLYDTNSKQQRTDKVGDYYYVWWYDADPDKPAQLVMRYTQALTASKVLTRTVDYDAPRKSAKKRKAKFFFNGPERKKNGDVLTWRVELYVDGQLRDSRQSYLWH